ncbi:hypothetical protein FACS1894201_07030 [Bacteroidia bacterium]|nr:hypothetical protein FACS1894201_07030 [Bacteroidia bacterium]
MGVLMKVNIVIVVLLLTVTACRTSQQVSEQPTDDHSFVMPSSNEILLERIKDSDVEFEAFSANFRGNLEFDKQTNTFDGQLRIKKDEKIWLTIAKMGIEVLRFCMTQDSIYVLNRMARTLMVRPVSYLTDMVGMSVDLSLVQRVLVGKFEPYMGIDARITESNKGLAIQYQQDNVEYDLNLDTQLFRWISLHLSDPNLRTIQFDYSDYTTLENKQVPATVNIVIKSEIAMTLQLRYSKMTLNQNLTFPFNYTENIQRW